MNHTIEEKSEGFYAVYKWGTYPDYSVLAGQTEKRFVNSYDTLEKAKADYPDADVGYRSAHNTFGHLPSEDDPVAGGMYPDDYDDGY